MRPAYFGPSTPPIDPAKPPRPTTEATANLGNMSDAVVKRLADHAWCAEHARPMSSTAGHVPAFVTKTIGNTATAKTNIAVLRAFVTLQPFLINVPGRLPPQMLMTVAIA